MVKAWSGFAHAEGNSPSLHTTMGSGSEVAAAAFRPAGRRVANLLNSTDVVGKERPRATLVVSEEPGGRSTLIEYKVQIIGS